MNYSAHVIVEPRDIRGNLIEEAAMEATMQKHPTKHDALAALAGDSKARVEVTLSEKIGGPSYSSLGVYVTVTLTCNQDQSTVFKASTEAHHVASALLEEYIEAGIPVLFNHIDKLGEAARKAGY